MDRYQRFEKPMPETAINENEIRITSRGLIRNYVSYATSLLQNNRGKHEAEIVLKAMGQAISKAVVIAEILKKRNPGLHQDSIISSVSITDLWEPLEDGLLPLETTRHVSMISIFLSTKVLNKNSPGYQPPLLSEQAKQPKYQWPTYSNQLPRQSPVQYDGDSFGQGRRGRGSGWVRGGYREHGGYEDHEGYGGYTNNRGYPSKQGYANNQKYPSNQGHADNQDVGYERGRGGGGRGYANGRGRVGGRGRGNQVF
ncbi:ribonuclease P protein subunit p25-like protein [Phalaenopsis equestris]|uniref:ribonuclease P protein subunit p25-like protein n=1 Tax=Phalaenopsis equestris TaxID=78828 RepID=UPI0009E27EE9|nr:ribonuclease P protein subunit p25-like protein [Phalaenopsis equestris]